MSSTVTFSHPRCMHKRIAVWLRAARVSRRLRCLSPSLIGSLASMLYILHKSCQNGNIARSATLKIFMLSLRMMLTGRWTRRIGEICCKWTCVYPGGLDFFGHIVAAHLIAIKLEAGVFSNMCPCGAAAAHLVSYLCRGAAKTRSILIETW